MSEYARVACLAGDWILQPILSFADWILYLDVAWSSELFVFPYGLEFRAICISMWLGVPSYLYFPVAWSSELFVAICCGSEFRAQ